MRAALACALCLSACGSTVTGTAGDASVDVAADVAPGSCAWRVGEVRDLTAALPGEPCALEDISSAGGGAWVLRRCGAEMGPVNRALVVDRVDADGRASPPVRVLESLSLTTPSPSIAVDDALGRRGVLIPEGPSQPASLVRLGPDASPLGATPLSQPPMSFSLAGYRRVMVNRAGFTAVAEQVRALWGVSMLQMDATGNSVSAVDLGLPMFPTAPFDRLSLPDGTFVMAWIERDRMTGVGALRVRRHDENGNGHTRDSFAIDDHPPDTLRIAVAPSGDGLLAAWEAVADTLPPLRTVAVRRLARDASPVGDTGFLTSLGFYGGGLDAAGARGDVLVTAVTGSGVLRLVVAALGADAQPRGELLMVSPVAPLAPERTVARVVATASGALVAFQRDARTVSVAPLTCEARAADR